MQIDFPIKVFGLSTCNKVPIYSILFINKINEKDYFTHYTLCRIIHTLH